MKLFFVKRTLFFLLFSLIFLSFSMLAQEHAQEEGEVPLSPVRSRTTDHRRPVPAMSTNTFLVHVGGRHENPPSRRGELKDIEDIPSSAAAAARLVAQVEAPVAAPSPQGGTPRVRRREPRMTETSQAARAAAPQARRFCQDMAGGVMMTTEEEQRSKGAAVVAATRARYGETPDGAQLPSTEDIRAQLAAAPGGAGIFGDKRGVVKKGPLYPPTPSSSAASSPLVQRRALAASVERREDCRRAHAVFSPQGDADVLVLDVCCDAALVKGELTRQLIARLGHRADRKPCELTLGACLVDVCALVGGWPLLDQIEEFMTRTCDFQMVGLRTKQYTGLVQFRTLGDVGLFFFDAGAFPNPATLADTEEQRLSLMLGNRAGPFSERIEDLAKLVGLRDGETVYSATGRFLREMNPVFDVRLDEPSETVRVTNRVWTIKLRGIQRLAKSLEDVSSLFRAAHVSVFQAMIRKDS